MINKVRNRRPGRPLSLEKRAAILQAAGQAFMEDGFAASLDQIAAIAGVSKQTAYNHFGSKEKLYREAVTSIMRAPVAEMIDRSLPVAETLRKYGRITLAKLVSERYVIAHRRLIEQAAAFPAMAKIHAEVGPGLSIQMLADYLGEQMTAGTLRKADARQAADDFLSLLQGMTRLNRLFGHIEEPSAAAVRRSADHTVGIFMRAYGAAR
jgi:TetR/AcrR family transcriptional repressor of mexJK operon